MKKIKIIGAAVVLVVIVGLVWFFAKGPTEQQVSKLDAVDTAGDFYRGWLEAAQQPATSDPSLATLAKSPILSKSLKDKIKTAQKDSDTTTDPVLCQTAIPEDISMRRVFMSEDEAQILVTSKDKNVTDQALVTLNRYNGGWYIDDIQCSLGEFEPEREFSFEKEGYLLKNSIPEPYDSKNWHLIFEDDGEPGHVVPLFFDAESQCTGLDGSVAVCKPDEFTEAAKVYVRSQMTERGADVVRMEFVK